MANFQFFKYHSYGDDFVVFDCRKSDPAINEEQIIYLCDRNFGIGSNGISCIYDSSTPADEKSQSFVVKIYKTDGTESDFEPNGVRLAIAHLAEEISKPIVKVEVNGKPFLSKLDKQNAIIKLNIGTPVVNGEMVAINGDHKIIIVQEFDDSIDYRMDYDFSKNYVQIKSENEIYIRTVERGFGEVFTSSSGVAASVAYCIANKLTGNNVKVATRGSTILNSHFEIVWEVGKPMIQAAPYSLVFSGTVDL